MPINGMRSPASAAPLPIAAASGSDAGADAIRTPGLGMDAPRPAELFERLQQRGGEKATPQPRIALAKLGSMRPEQGVSTLSEAARGIAAKVASEAGNGKIALLVQHSPSTLKAAAGVAAMGLMALSKDLFARR